MPSSAVTPATERPRHRGQLAWHGVGLIGMSIGCTLALESLHVSAAWLLGAIAAAIFFASRETPVCVPAPAFVFAQAVIGCMIARTIPLALLGEIGKSWPLFILGVGSVVVLSTLLGWAMARWRLLPGTTAIWGSFPGAAMALMAEVFGADVQLVALMQYLRVLVAGVAATTVTRIWVPVHTAAVSLIPTNVPLHGVAFIETLALAGVGAWTAKRLRIPAGGLLVPLFAGVALQDTGRLAIELPWWLLAVCYSLVGWSIGLRFTPAILRHAAHLLPRVLGGILMLVVLCGGLGWALARFVARRVPA